MLRAGDRLKVTFPGAPDLDTPAAIRRDGRITMPLVGEIEAAGLTPNELEKILLEKYGPQLQVKELSVTVQSAPFTVYVTGFVVRPGKVTSERRLTALEAIMEAGGFDHVRAKVKAVQVIRQENGLTVNYQLDFRPMFRGKPIRQFDLKPSDIIYVPERIVFL